MATFTLFKLLTCGSFFLLTLPCLAQCTEEQTNLDNLQKEYGVLFVELEQQGNAFKNALPDSTNPSSIPGGVIRGQIKFKPRTISFNMVEVTMKLNKMAFNVPQVTMRTKSFSVPTSTTKMKIKPIGFGIVTKVPVVVVGSKLIKFKSPEVKMARTEVVTKTPQFTSKRREITFSAPEFKVNSPIPEDGPAKDLENKSNEISKGAEELNRTAVRLEREQKNKAKIFVSNLFTCVQKDLELQKISAVASFSSELAQLDAAIQEVKTQGLNPQQIKSDDGTTSDLLKERENAVAAQSESMRSIDQALSELQTQRASVLTELES